MNKGVDVAKVEKAKYLHEFDRYVQCPTWGYPTEGAYYRDSQSVDAVCAVRIPFLGINAEDDPVCFHVSYFFSPLSYLSVLMQFIRSRIKPVCPHRKFKQTPIHFSALQIGADTWVLSSGEAGAGSRLLRRLFWQSFMMRLIMRRRGRCMSVGYRRVGGRFGTRIIGGWCCLRRRWRRRRREKRRERGME
jgi:hypothetical protein